MCEYSDGVSRSLFRYRDAGVSMQRAMSFGTCVSSRDFAVIEDSRAVPPIRLHDAHRIDVRSPAMRYPSVASSG